MDIALLLLFTLDLTFHFHKPECFVYFCWIRIRYQLMIISFRTNIAKHMVFGMSYVKKVKLHYEQMSSEGVYLFFGGGVFL